MWHTNIMNQSKSLIKIVYLVASIFLIYSGYIYFIEKDYWQLFLNIEFLMILFYMNFIYKKQALNLTRMSILFLIIHFIGYGINAYFLHNSFKMILSILLVIGMLVYLLFKKKKKYTIHLNKKFK